jgi:hypothetical protein
MLSLGSFVRRLNTITAASLIFACLLIFQPYGRSIAAAAGIPEAEAVHLLRTYLRSQGYDTKNSPLEIDSNPDSSHPDDSEKGFYLYDVYVDTPERLVTIGALWCKCRNGRHLGANWL